MNKSVVLIDPKYDEWTGSRRGPCCCWHGAGRQAVATYSADDGVKYIVSYKREFPFGTEYAVVPAEGDEIVTYPSLKAAAKSPHFAAFKALYTFAAEES